MDISSLHKSLANCSHGWVDITKEQTDSICLCKFSEIPSQSSQPPVITHCLSVKTDFTWLFHVHDHHLSPQNCNALNNVPETLSVDTLHALLQQVNTLNVCCGQPDAHFLSMIKREKGRIISSNGQTKAYVDEYAPVTLGGDTYQATIRTVSCEILTGGNKCLSCKAYRNALRAMHSRWVRRNADEMSNTTSHSNERYLNTPQRKEKMSKLKKRLSTAEKQVNKLRLKIKEFSERHGESVDPDLHSGLLSVMRDSADFITKTFPEGTFARLFWEEQVKAASVKDNRQFRWHALTIKFCLNIKLISSAAYHTLRTSGFIKLPSERTLRDYMHHFKSPPGFHPDLNEQLKKEAI